MIEVFKTNVQLISDSIHIIDIIKKQFPNYKINFDLEDCDKILRVEGDKIASKSIVDCLNYLGYACVELE
jgi:hypothetical protein